MRTDTLADRRLEKLMVVPAQTWALGAAADPRSKPCRQSRAAFPLNKKTKPHDGAALAFDSSTSPGDSGQSSPSERSCPGWPAWV